MSETLPLPAPPIDYITHGPWTTCIEWSTPIPHIIDGQYRDLRTALYASLAAPGFYEPGGPNRSVIVDVRGVVVLGWRHTAADGTSIVYTDEVRSTLIATGLASPVEIAAWETEDLESMWRL